MSVLGSGPSQRPSCIPKDCRVEARVTAFQTSIGNKRKPFVAAFPGRIVAWSIKLGTPSNRDREELEELFNGPSRAQLSVLRPIKKKGMTFYKLRGQTPVELLRPFFGQTTTFTLGRPLKVGKGMVVALTIPSWAPMFVQALPSSYSWRASRVRKKDCFTRDDLNRPTGANVNAGKPQTSMNSERPYTCVYSGNRLLYSATLVRRPAGN